MTFDFYKDELVSIWERTYFSVEADSLEEAVEKIKSDPDELDVEGIEVKDSEFLYDTKELVPTSIPNCPTIEIYQNYPNNSLIYTNK